MDDRKEIIHMKIFLISINQQFRKDLTDISALGVRYLSSYLKSIGHKVDILFLCKPQGEKESEGEIAQMIELIRERQPDLIGVSLMSYHFFRAVAVTRAIKKAGGLAPVIWGGIHPTAKPRECLEFTDLVCVGEGELAMEKLMDNLDRFKDLKIEGIWHKDGDKIVETGAGILVHNIDSLPYPDYDLDDKYIIRQKKLIPFSAEIGEILKQYSSAAVGAHRLMSSRGCPNACAYCCNSIFKKFYGGGHLRWRSVDNFIGEMIEVKNKFPFVNRFKIADDNFTANDIEWIREFNKQYKQKINFPFHCLLSPLTVTEEKMDLLVDAGLDLIQIGLQSGSDRVNKRVYYRPMGADDFLRAVKLLEKYRDHLSFVVDVIVDNPYEQDEDLIETINVLNQIKKPFLVNIFSLTFFPGTALYQRAAADKILTDYNNEYLSVGKKNEKEDRMYNEKNVFNKIIYLTPRLTRQKIDQLTNQHRRFLTRLYINALYFAYINKNRVPPAVLKLVSGALKRFVSAAK